MKNYFVKIVLLGGDSITRENLTAKNCLDAVTQVVGLAKSLRAPEVVDIQATQVLSQRSTK